MLRIDIQLISPISSRLIFIHFKFLLIWVVVAVARGNPMDAKATGAVAPAVVTA
jgi:hypothetical protein